MYICMTKQISSCKIHNKTLYQMQFYLSRYVCLKMVWLRPKHVVLYSYVNIKIHTYSNIFIMNVLFLFEKRLQRRYENENEISWFADLKSKFWIAFNPGQEFFLDVFWHWFNASYYCIIRERNCFKNFAIFFTVHNFAHFRGCWKQ
jgi:hypothetical protein